MKVPGYEGICRLCYEPIKTDEGVTVTDTKIGPTRPAGGYTKKETTYRAHKECSRNPKQARARIARLIEKNFSSENGKEARVIINWPEKDRAQLQV